MLKRWKCGSVEGWKGGRMEGGGFLNHGLHRLHGLHGEERLLSARFSFNAGTTNQEIKKQGINGMNDIYGRS